MKKIILILSLVMTANLAAQGDKHEKIKALKAAHITEALSLTATEAEKFWPIYNAYEDKMHDLRKAERKEILGPLRNEGLETMTDAQANALIDKALVFKQNDVTYRTEMLNALRKVISPKKVIKLKKAEDDFKKQLLERYRNKRREKR
ncbi:hypothetical protein ACFQO1_05030 [Jejudonia soesokkakensis]|uniref:Sensor of ECF-type sigma factor n=1 Tax=Jejudonia soesokkakensis TaxID=1323432 RepID=A0ABW2MT98_9FLAO